MIAATPMLVSMRYDYRANGESYRIPAEYGRERQGVWEPREPWSLEEGDVIRITVAGDEQIRIVHAIVDDGHTPAVTVRLACDDAGQIDGLETARVAHSVDVLA